VAEPERREFTDVDGSKVEAIERFNYARVAAHPTDPERVAVGFRVEAGEVLMPPPTVRSVVAVSTDGGVSFPKLVDTIDASIPRADLAGSDAPAMAFGPEDGALYSFTKERPRPRAMTQAMLPMQPDFPKPLGEPAKCQPAAANPAAPELLPNPTEPPPAANEPGAGARLVMSKTTDNGQTWQASVVDERRPGLPGVPDHPRGRHRRRLGRDLSGLRAEPVIATQPQRQPRHLLHDVQRRGRDVERTVEGQRRRRRRP